MKADTPFAEQAVKQYLSELDRALAVLPSRQAAELREQIEAHVEDTLAAGAGAGEVARMLARLGPPDVVVREASADHQPSAWRRLRRVPWWGWVLVALTLAIAGSSIGLFEYIDAQRTAPPLTFAGTSGWLYPQDWSHAVDTQADGASQSTAPIRSGQVQGFLISIRNPSSWNETVLGLEYDFGPGGPGMTVRVGDSASIERGGSAMPGTKFILPATIPPGGIRMLRLVWKSTTCLEGGGAQGINQIYLEVKVGWVTRTEVIQLPTEFALSGPSRSGSCI